MKANENQNTAIGQNNIESNLIFQFHLARSIIGMPL